MSAGLIGWAGDVVGIAGLVAYFAIVLRQPKTVRMLNGAGLLLTSLALFPARMQTAIARGPFAFATDMAIVLLILSVLAQAVSGWRNRAAWTGWSGARAKRPGTDKSGATPRLGMAASDVRGLQGG